MLFGRDVTILPKAVALWGERGPSQGARPDTTRSLRMKTYFGRKGDRPGRGGDCNHGTRRVGKSRLLRFRRGWLETGVSEVVR